MALTQVRVKLEDSWTVLSYNAATGRYEGTLTAPGSSINQPGGYYALEAEAVNSEGRTAVLSGAQYHGLRLPVRETQAPALTLVSPAQGWLTANSAVFTFRAQDEAEGSGIDAASAKASIDGAEVPCTVTMGTSGYTVRVTVSGLSEGPHTVTASISDRDGNRTTASAAYQVDTVPPELRVDRPSLRHVVDEDAVLIAGAVLDGVSLTVGGAAVPLGEDGGFSVKVPLKVGENRIPVTALDGAGWETTMEVYMIRMVTGRLEGDPAQILELVKRPVWEWTDQELDWFNNSLVRGAYNPEDAIRVGSAVRYLSGELEKRGYLPVPVPPKTDWSARDTPDEVQMEDYLGNVDYIRRAQGVELPPIPETMRRLTTRGANQIEKALVEADAVTPRYRAWSSGEISCGGV